MSEYPRIVSRKETRVSPFVTLVEKSVEFSPGGGQHVYHCLTQADYVGIFAMTTDGLIPIVRQYRPAVEQFPWEFPAGTVDPRETPEEAARRELYEEVGFRAEQLVPLGCFIPDTGRLQIKSHAFFARVPNAPAGGGEAGLEMRLVTLAQLHQMMHSMEFRHQLHWAIYAAARLHGVSADLGLE